MFRVILKISDTLLLSFQESIGNKISYIAADQYLIPSCRLTHFISVYFYFSPCWACIVYSVSGRRWRASNGTRITTKNDKHNVARAYRRTETWFRQKRNNVLDSPLPKYSCFFCRYCGIRFVAFLHVIKINEKDIR